MLAKEKGKSRWVKCPNCGHKLFRVFSEETMTTRVSAKDQAEGDIEIKCHSCKEIVTIVGGAK